MNADTEIRVVNTEPDVRLVRELFLSYQAWLSETVCSERLSQEIASLPEPYTPSRGRLWLALVDGRPVGCIGIRPYNDDACEMKRLYVQPDMRRCGVGRALAKAAVEFARQAGYRQVLLSTLPLTMEPALALYREVGFRETTPFDDHSHVSDNSPAVLHMSLPFK